MELKELTDRTLELFGVTAPEQLGAAMLAACDDPDKLRSFCELAFTKGQKWSRIKWQDEKSTYKGFHIIVKDKDGQQFELQTHS